MNSIRNITSYHHLYYKLSHNKQYIIHDAQPIFHKSCSNITNETFESFVICSTKSQPLFGAKTMQFFAVRRRCDRIYLCPSVPTIKETKTNIYKEEPSPVLNLPIFGKHKGASSQLDHNSAKQFAELGQKWWHVFVRGNAKFIRCVTGQN